MKEKYNPIIIIFTIWLINSTVHAQAISMFTDVRDGMVYKAVKIGKLEWMSQNLNFRHSNSWCYNNDPKNCEQFGRLYSYVGATQACPSGWQLPTRNDWDDLIKHVETDSAAYNLSVDGQSGFNALYAGVRYDYGGYNHIHENAFFWSQKFDEYETARVYHFGRGMLTVSWINSFSGNGFSVRCVRR